MVDPTREDEVLPVLLASLRDRFGPAVSIDAPLSRPGDGITTFIWFFEPAGDDVPTHWRRPLALRIFPRAEDDGNAEQETAIHAWARRHRYPVPEVLAWGPHDDGLGLPYMVMAKAPGEPMLRRVLSHPWEARRLVRRLAHAHRQLHEIPFGADAPVPYDGPLVDRRLAVLAHRVERPGPPDLRPRLARLRDAAPRVRDETPVVLHNDFHPLNALVAPGPNGLTVIDWSDASAGDPHHDVARSLAIFRVAAIAANNQAERVALGLLHPVLSRTYRRAYERAAGAPLDDERLRIWLGFHLLFGAIQVLELHDDLAAQPRTEQSANVPPSLADDLLAWFDDVTP